MGRQRLPPSASCAQFVGVGSGLVWTPPSPGQPLEAPSPGLAGRGTTDPKQLGGPGPDQTQGEAPPSGAWGPLAVAAGAPNGDEALITGTLRISSDCVTVRAGGEDVLVVWAEETTTWDDETKTISYSATHDGDRTVLRDGDDFAFGGSGWGAGRDRPGPGGLGWLYRVGGRAGRSVSDTPAVVSRRDGASRVSDLWTDARPPDSGPWLAVIRSQAG